jgi:hypothetical protein
MSAFLKNFAVSALQTLHLRHAPTPPASDLTHAAGQRSRGGSTGR